MGEVPIILIALNWTKSSLVLYLIQSACAYLIVVLQLPCPFRHKLNKGGHKLMLCYVELGLCLIWFVTWLDLDALGFEMRFLWGLIHGAESLLYCYIVLLSLYFLHEIAKFLQLCGCKHIAKPHKFPCVMWLFPFVIFSIFESLKVIRIMLNS